MGKIRDLKIFPEKIRGLKILGFSEENTPDGYSPLKMTAPLMTTMLSGGEQILIRDYMLRLYDDLMVTARALQ